MRTTSSTLFLILVAALIGLEPAAEAREGTVQAPEGFVALFNGVDLGGWHGMPTYDPRDLVKMGEEKSKALLDEWAAQVRKHWSVQDGELVNDGLGAFLTTDKDYGDIELRVDYKTVARADSGIYLRATPQVQIWDYTKEGGKHDIGAAKGSGGLWNNAPGSPGKDPLVFADKPFGQWNSLRIIQVGARTTVYLNDKLVVDHALMENYFERNAPLKAPLFARGPIQLQTHGGETSWRNVFLREIPTSEANAILASHGAEGFQPIFDGKTTAGWAGAAANYEVVDNSLRCKPGKGGVIYHEKELADFVARVEFRLPPGGNNGLAIRYPGQGDTAYDGMCELQVLDDTAPKYGKLDPRQAHGSAYGMVAAHRGYLRPVGEWNEQEVTVQGSKIKVELNGTVILDTDLAPVSKFMSNSPHPGKDRKAGFFGFAGHDDPVEFRNIAIKPLPGTGKETTLR